MSDKELVNRLNRILYDIDALVLEAKKLVGDRVDAEELEWVQDIFGALYAGRTPALSRTIQLIEDGAA